ncbi:hypothetical protein GJAV_G00158330 [Gymnothorax javanicus]|nr:hypothetical protein GJAV_G00158330 [Gymnothorax javanicus]
MMASNPPVENGDSINVLNPMPEDGDALMPQMYTVEEVLQQVNVLSKENRDLKEALKQTNASMKERFQGLSSWKEKQKEEREFLEGRLDEAKERVSVLTKCNEELRKKLLALEGSEGAGEGEVGRCSAEVEALKAQVARLQAEKSDLVAMNSELQLKMRPGSPEDSFVEIRIADGGVHVTKDMPNGQKDSPTTKRNPTFSRLDSEELTVSQLLQSLRKETQNVERLQLELQAASQRISELEKGDVKQVESEAQTSLLVGETEGPAARAQTKEVTQQEDPRKESDAELGHLKAQMAGLIKELQQAQTKLDDAEDMKKTLHDRSRSMEQDLATLRAQLVDKQQVQAENQKLKIHVESLQSKMKMEQKKAEDERCKGLEQDLSRLRTQLEETQQVQAEKEQLKQQLESLQSKMKSEQKAAVDERCGSLEANLAMLRTQLEEKQQVQTENERLKLQLESVQAVIRVEQKKAEDERRNMAQVKDEYSRLYEDFNALKQEMRKKEPIMSNEELKELQARLDAAEQALATKQQKIDEMKQEIFRKEQELDTISVFKAQAEVYSSDFYAERAAREKIHEEKERLVAQLEFLKRQNSQLQDEMESMGRQSLNEMQRRHVQPGAGSRGGGQQNVSLAGRGLELDIPEHACPKCNEVLPDLDTLQIHIMDCII